MTDCLVDIEKVGRKKIPKCFLLLLFVISFVFLSYQTVHLRIRYVVGLLVSYLKGKKKEKENERQIKCQTLSEVVRANLHIIISLGFSLERVTHTLVGKKRMARKKEPTGKEGNIYLIDVQIAHT